MSDRIHTADLQLLAVDGMTSAPRARSMAIELLSWRASFGAEIQLEARLAADLTELDEMRTRDPARRARIYAMLVAHARSACPEAESLAASERRVRP